jgi:hypothetical protein
MIKTIATIVETIPILFRRNPIKPKRSKTRLIRKSPRAEAKEKTIQ